MVKITIILGRENSQFLLTFREQEGFTGTSVSIFEEDLIRSSCLILFLGGDVEAETSIDPRVPCVR
jgi:hypothetical protein